PLMHERAVVAGRNENQSGGWAGGFTPLQLVLTMQQLGLDRDPALRQQLGDLIVRFEVARIATEQTKRRLARGETPGAELSITKLTYSENRVRLANLAATVLGLRIAAD